MKFSNGSWLMQEGIGCFSPKQIYYSSIEADRVHIFAPTRKIQCRQDTIDGIALTLEITTPFPEVIRVRAWHHKGAEQNNPGFDLASPASTSLLSSETIDAQDLDSQIVIKSGRAKLVIEKEDWSMTYYDNLTRLCSSQDQDLSYIRTNWRGNAYVSDPNQKAYMRQQLSLGVGELVYGLGERFTAFAKNGQSVEIWNEDGGTSTQQAYKNVPFYISNRGYGIFVNHTGRVSFEIASENVKKAGFSVPGESLDYYFFNGPSMKEVLWRYTRLTGRPALPPAWSFGLWLSTSFTTDYDELTVMKTIDGMLDRNINLNVFHFDCFWMKEFSWSDFLWDKRSFPDTRSMLERIHKRGLKISVWINPYVAQESRLFEEGMQKGYFLKRRDGSVWQWDMWQPGMAIVDFTNPAAKRWYQDQLAGLVDMGVDCFKTDFGERIPVDCVYYNSMDPEKMHNLYSYLYNQAVFELLKEKKGESEAVLFARSATAGSQQFPVHWGGDCWSDYESMAESLRGGLSLQLSGFSFWSHDIGGFERTSTADVYKRWCAFGLLSSHSRLHGSSTYRVPWVYDEEACDVLRKFVKLKARLMPYIWSAAVYARKTGIPLMRAMVLEYSRDKNCAHLDRQYMFGNNLLVAPIFNEKGIGEVYLPETEGLWTDFFTNDTFEGGRWYSRKYGYDEIPLFVKPNSILPIGARDDCPDYDYADGVTYRIYEPRREAFCDIYVGDRKTAEVSLTRKENDRYEITVCSDKSQPYNIEVHGHDIERDRIEIIEENQAAFFH